MPGRRPTRHTTQRHTPRRGAALLLCLFVVFMISSLVLNLLDTETLQFSALRNVEDYQRALYLADAGINHAYALLKQDATLRGVFDSDGDTVATGTAVPEGLYQFTITGAPGNSLAIGSSGSAGGVVRSVEAIIILP